MPCDTGGLRVDRSSVSAFFTNRGLTTSSISLLFFLDLQSAWKRSRRPFLSYPGSPA